MIVNRSIGNFIWVDLSSPTEEEAESLVLAHRVDPRVAKDLIYPTPKQQTREFDDSIYAVLHIPSFKHSHSIDTRQEIDCVITKDTLITARYDSIDALHNYAKTAEVADILKNGDTIHPFFGLMKEIYASLFNELYYIEDWLRDIERNVFQGKEREMVIALSDVSRNLLNFERIVSPHKAIWQTLLATSKEKFGRKFEMEAQSILEDWERLFLFERSLASMASEIRETNNSLLSTKQNEVMKVLTILAFVTFPLSLIAAIFGMNTKYIPLVGRDGDFWMVMVIMCIATIAMFGFFKFKKWL